MPCLAGCAGTTKLRPGERRVRAVEVVGNDAFSDKEITRKLATRSTRAYDPMALEVDRSRVVAMYRERGWFSAEVEDVEVKKVGPAAVDVRIEVEEGKPTRIAKVDLVGAPQPLSLDELHKEDVFHHPRYLAAKERLKAELRKNGYAHARVSGDVLVDRDERTASVKVIVDAGPLVRIGEVRVTGNEKIPTETILARLDFGSGDVYDPDALAESRARLYQLGYFQSVRLDLEEDARPATSDVTVHVAEGTRRHELRLGAGLALDRTRLEVHGRAGYTVRSWLHPLITLRLDARPGFLVYAGPTDRGFTGEARGGLQKIDFLAPRLTLGIEAAYELDTYEAYSTRGPRGRIGLDRPFWSERLRLGVGWEVRNFRVFTDEPELAPLLGGEEPQRVAYFDQRVAYDGRDEPLDARRGVYAQVTIEEGGAFAGGAFTYLRATPELRLYAPLVSRIVLAGRGRAGWFSSKEALAPLTRRYFDGGASGHRGFAYRRLSPTVVTDDGREVPIGGEGLLETSAEARFDVTKVRGEWLGVTVFLDGGDVPAQLGDLELGNLHWAAGAGLRYNTIVGPIRLDVGMRLNRLGPTEPDPGRRFAAHFSLGEAF